MKSVIEDQYTAGRAYFLCVIGMLLFESCIHLPQYLLALSYRGQPFAKSSSTHNILSTYLHKLSTIPSLVPFLTNHRLPNLLRLAVFIGLNILWGWNRLSFTADFTFFGYLCIANGGLGVLLAARSNLFSLILRIPSTTLLIYHRWIGRATIIHATLHFAFNTQQYLRTGQLETVFQDARIIVGITAWGSLAIIFLTSLSFVRRRFYELFLYSHFLFLVFIGGACYHALHGYEFLLPGVGLWLIDRAIRFVYNFKSVTVKEVKVLQGGLTKFTFSGVTTTAPGQVAWVRIPGVSSVTSHPFTVASAPGEEALVAIKGIGGYTKKVQEVVGAGRGFNGALGNGIKVKVAGPYRVGAVKWGIHPVTVLVAGGVGITPGISIATHILNQAAVQTAGNDEESLQAMWHIHLLWAVKDRSNVAWFQEELANMANMAKHLRGRATLDITIHVTGSNQPVMQDGSIELNDGPESDRSGAYPGTIVKGRPDMVAFFSDVKSRRAGLDTVVNACGPRPLIASVRKAAAKVSGADGHFHVEEEVFEF